MNARRLLRFLLLGPIALVACEPVDPASMTVATATLAAVIAIACAVPVRNAMRVDVVRELK